VLVLRGWGVWNGLVHTRHQSPRGDKAIMFKGKKILSAIREILEDSKKHK
jgi:hypothetical protein